MNWIYSFIFRHIASFLSVFKLAVIGLIILGKDPFTYFNTETPGIWLWAQENKVSEGQLCGQGSYGVWESLKKR